MQSFRCRGCGGLVQVPDLEPADRARIATLWPSNLGAAMEEVRRLTGWDLREAKRLVIHLTTTPHRCHFGPCAAELTEVAGICPVCRRVNVDWSSARYD